MSLPQYVDNTIYGPITPEERGAFYVLRESRKANIPIKVSVGPVGGPYQVEVLDISQAPGKFIKPFKCPFPGCQFHTSRRRTVYIHFDSLHTAEAPPGMSWDDHPSVRWFSRPTSAKQPTDNVATLQAETPQASSNVADPTTIKIAAHVNIPKATEANSVPTTETRQEQLTDTNIKLGLNVSPESVSKAEKPASRSTVSSELAEYDQTAADCGADTKPLSMRKRPRLSKTKTGSQKGLAKTCQVKERSQDDTGVVTVAIDKTDETVPKAVKSVAATSAVQEESQVSQASSPISDTSSHIIHGDRFASQPTLSDPHPQPPNTSVRQSTPPICPTAGFATPTREAGNDQISEGLPIFSDDGQQHDPFAEFFDGQYESLLEQQFGDNIPWREPFMRAKAGGPDANDAMSELTRVVDEGQSHWAQLPDHDWNNTFGAVFGTRSQHDALKARANGSGPAAAAASAELDRGLAACVSFIDQMNVMVQAEPDTADRLASLLHTPGSEAHAEFHRLLADARNMHSAKTPTSFDAADTSASSNQVGQDNTVADGGRQLADGGAVEMEVD